ncbi:MBOAT family O-acyltransferase [Alsobacter sp. R-9]
MLFNSLTFFVFLAIVYGAYLVLPFRGQNWLLLIAGYVFYGWWDVRFLFLIACSTAVDFSIGVLLSQRDLDARTRRTVALYLLGSAILFLVPDWSGEHSASPWQATQLGIATTAGVAVFLILGRLGISRLGKLAEDQRRRILIYCSVGLNLVFLGTFKYFNFFIGSAEEILRSAGLDPHLFHLNIILPVGISFYTFQSLSYTIDVYRRVIKPTTHFWDFALFVAYFPPMVAGPIERGRHLLPQLVKRRRVRLVQVGQGVALIIVGLMKKVAVADGLAPAVNSVYNSTGAVSQADVALATVLFAFQIFCDFSGYSDIARGVSKLFGIELTLNFNAPYLSRNPSEFWRRWHISLSSWLRDYLYISLGGNRRGEMRTHVNLFATMLLGGLWHGAAWNFVLWGAYQGALLSIHRAWADVTGRRRAASVAQDAASTPAVDGSNAIRIAVTVLQISVFFLFVCYGWMLFRASSFEQIVTFTAALFGAGGGSELVMSKPTSAALAGLAVIAIIEINDYRVGMANSYLKWPAVLQGMLYAAMIYIMAMGLSNEPAQFIYFQF